MRVLNAMEKRNTAGQAARACARERIGPDKGGHWEVSEETK